MILKIKRYGTKQEWWIIDRIRKISVSAPQIKTPATYNDNAEIVILDKELKCNCDGESSRCSKCVDYIWLICRTDDGDEFVVIFDTMMYLLNDEGKTIEKIVANHND